MAHYVISCGRKNDDRQRRGAGSRHYRSHSAYCVAFKALVQKVVIFMIRVIAFDNAL